MSSRRDSKLTSNSIFTQLIYVYSDFYITKYHRKWISHCIIRLALKSHVSLRKSIRKSIRNKNTHLSRHTYRLIKG